MAVLCGSRLVVLSAVLPRCCLQCHAQLVRHPNNPFCAVLTAVRSGVLLASMYQPIVYLCLSWSLKSIHEYLGVRYAFRDNSNSRSM